MTEIDRPPRGHVSQRDEPSGAMRILFVCSANISRSRTAEEVFRVLTWNLSGRTSHEVRSAGVLPEEGGRALTEADLEWAHVVCVMESGHEAHITARWPGVATKIRVLGIPDIYSPGDPVLRDLLTRHVLELLAEARSADID